MQDNIAVTSVIKKIASNPSARVLSVKMVQEMKNEEVIVDCKIIPSEVTARNWAAPEIVMPTGAANCILAWVEVRMEIGAYFQVVENC